VGLASGQWAYFGITIDTKLKKGKLLILTNSFEKSVDFTPQYEYDLRRYFKIYYGSFSDTKPDMDAGLVGDIGPFFYGDAYLEHIEQYWMANYFNFVPYKNAYVNLEYIFENYKDIEGISDRISSEGKGYINGSVVYDGLTGITMRDGSFINISKQVIPFDTFMGSLCFFFAFRYNEPLSDTPFVLYSRGEKGKENSIEILLKKNDTKREIIANVGFIDNSKRLQIKEYKSNDTISSGVFNNLQVCVSVMAESNISGAIIYLNDKITKFPPQQNLSFYWNETASKNVILSETKHNYTGNITLNLFSIIEGAGNAVWSLERSNPLVIVDLHCIDR